jgi:beta-glucosidase
VTPLDRFDHRAAELVARMSLDEKLQLVTGYEGIPTKDGRPLIELPEQEQGLTPEMLPPAGAVGSDGFVPGVPRLGVPDLQLSGAGNGITDLVGRVDGAATSFPSAAAQAATWNRELVRAFGQRLGAEARAHGINVVLGAAANLAIEPRSGRVFEFHGEDPVLAGELVREEVRGTQEQGVVASVKHFAANFQETGRFVVNVVVEERALREGELLAFEIAVRGSDVGAVMTAYNKLNGTYTTESPYLLDQVLKREWGFRGWVMSDWGSAQSTVASAMAGLDQEFPLARWFGRALKRAVEAGEVPLAPLDDMVRRILRTLLAVGVMERGEDWPRPSPREAHAQSLPVARQIAEEGTVLLKNGGLLPIDPAFAGRVAVIGLHADVGVPVGTGSAMVNPIGGSPVSGDSGGPFAPRWLPSSPLRALRAALPAAEVLHASGEDVQAAVALARDAELVVLFADQQTSEHVDVESLDLPRNQPELIEAVAAANPHTVIVLQTGGVVTMPWEPRVPAILAAWYPGHAGAEAIAAVLTGAVNPSGKTPLTFPRSEEDLPHRTVFAPPEPAPQATDATLVNLLAEPGASFDAVYDEGLLLGWKWYEAMRIEPRFAFGHGLSYTAFDVRDAEAATMADGIALALLLVNVGERAGAEVVQAYAALPQDAHASPRRLVGWEKVALAEGEQRRVTIIVPRLYLSVWDVAEGAWCLPQGTARIDLASSSRDVRASLGVVLDPLRRESKPP